MHVILNWKINVRRFIWAQLGIPSAALPRLLTSSTPPPLRRSVAQVSDIGEEAGKRSRETSLKIVMNGDQWGSGMGIYHQERTDYGVYVLIHTPWPPVGTSVFTFCGSLPRNVWPSDHLSHSHHNSRCFGALPVHACGNLPALPVSSVYGIYWNLLPSCAWKTHPRTEKAKLPFFLVPKSSAQGGSINRGTQNGCFIMQNPMKMDDFGVVSF